jgi:pyruvate dehydrogenase E2 component (dihydrolipoamide acetyltransferase)
MPKFEMAQETGKVLAWLKREGEMVNKGEALLEVETDKVNQEVESPATGVLSGICAAPGQVVPIAAPIAYILKPGESLSGMSGSRAESSFSSLGTAAQEPAAGAALGKPSQPDALEQAAEAAGVQPKATPLAARLAHEYGLDLHKINGTGPMGRITKEDVELAAAAPAAVPAVSDGKVRADPPARRVARELGEELRTGKRSRPDGRIQPEDVEAAKAAAAAAVSPVTAAAPAAEPVSQPAVEPAAIMITSGPAVRRVVPLTNVRKTIAERMLASVREAPQFNVSLDVDMTRSLAIVEDLARFGGQATAQGAAQEANKPKITLTALLVKAVAYGLVAHPGANAAFSPEGIVEYEDINVGVATAIDSGLIVPVVRSANKLGLRGIAAALGDLTTRAREGKLKLDDLTGGTFTVSNLGMFGIETFTAILNPPQAAILAVGRASKRAVVVPTTTGDDKVEIKPMASLTLTADHRVLDGASAARFLATIQSVLEHPGLLLE